MEDRHKSLKINMKKQKRNIIIFSIVIFISSLIYYFISFPPLIFIILYSLIKILSTNANLIKDRTDGYKAKIISYYLIGYSFIFFVYSFFDIITFFSLAMFVFGLISLGVAIFGIGLILYSFFQAFKRRNIKYIFIGIPLGIWAIYIFPMAGNIAEYGIEYKIHSNEKMLIKVCKDILQNKPPDKNVWDDRFALWNSVKKAGRKSVVHHNGIVYINIQGSPDNEGGFAYNPQHKPPQKNKKWLYFKPMFGVWYKYDFDY